MENMEIYPVFSLPLEKEKPEPIPQIFRDSKPKNYYEDMLHFEKDKKQFYIFSANKLLKQRDYTKVFLVQLRHTAVEWEFHAVHNESEERREFLKKDLLGNRMVYHQKLSNKNKVFCAFHSDHDMTFTKSVIKKIYGKAGSKPIKERANISTLSNAKFGFEADFINIPFAFWSLGERNGAYLEAQFGHLKEAKYRVEKFFMHKETKQRYLKLKDFNSKDIIYLKSVDQKDRKIEIPAKVSKRLNKTLSKLNRIKGDLRLKKGFMYSLSALHCGIYVPLQIANLFGVLGGWGLL